MKNMFRFISHCIFRLRSFNNRTIKNIAKKTKNRKILEIGSGKQLKGKYYYSTKRLFDSSNEFIQSDINPTFGHKVIDITKFKEKNQYDIVLCLNVLEHVFEYQKAIKNIYKALRNNGVAILFIPVFYPLHDEPNDYWRFTEHSLKKLLQDFKEVKIKHSGIRQYPFAYFIEAKK